MKRILLILLVVTVNWEVVHGRASVKVTPNVAQFWEYHNVSVSCEDFGPDWTVWRFTKSGDLSGCGSGWGKIRISGCHMNVKHYDSGIYWCESKYRESSDTINITVTGGPVILETPVQLEEGLEVVLRCRFKSGAQNLKVDFYRDEVLIKSSPEPQTTIRFRRDQQGAYTCKDHDNNHHSLPVHMYLQDNSPAPVLVLSPNSDQFFEYSPVNFSCEPHTEGWTVQRHKPKTGSKPGPKTGSQCGSDWGSSVHGFVCVLSFAKRLDSTIYWCGKNTRRSNSVQLQVKDSGVILQVPLLPVFLGQTVNLTCQHHPPTTLPAYFYKDEHFLSEWPAGKMVLQSVAQSDEGLYQCEMGGQKSQLSPLRVRAAELPPDSLRSARSLLLLRYIIVFLPYVASTVLFIIIYREAGGSVVQRRQRRRVFNLQDPQDEDVIPNVTTEYQF
ncbi:Fc receptor-like protein 5 [Boleophthalmus pectinirostris]|uniref:Fc receptor-like protein 5 n=1 Tax=Boleophthalmus pectinirostris TaxID=150288 RepID=UPI00242E24A3|nr:Fc receptor-like protein 5 [Boleophthalmus pectinirostris]